MGAVRRVYCALAWCKAVPTARSVPGVADRRGEGVPCKHDRVRDRGRALPEHLSEVAVPLGLIMGGCWRGPRRRSPKTGGGLPVKGGGVWSRLSSLPADPALAHSTPAGPGRRARMVPPAGRRGSPSAAGPRSPSGAMRTAGPAHPEHSGAGACPPAPWAWAWAWAHAWRLDKRPNHGVLCCAGTFRSGWLRPRASAKETLTLST